MKFNSHVQRTLDAAARLVNGLTPGLNGGTEVTVPKGELLRATVGEAVSSPGHQPHPSLAEAKALAAFAPAIREVFVAAESGDTARAADGVNALLTRTGARPRLDLAEDGTWNLHFHGPTTRFAPGWAAGIAAGLAMALGVDESGRLGVCSADACDRAYVDGSKNARRQFCSTRCQNRVKAAAHRARQASSIRSA